IWLDASVESLLARCMTMSGRPLFRDEASFRTLYTQRVPSYQLSDYRIDSSGDPLQVVAEILRLDLFDGPRENRLVVGKPLA
ncbi:MAG TPA: shikimate kinase, partial [Candidatus Acidoferrum sp.]|nr:shikimate kinase [Candidatus Acidoferrum sp.]